MCRRRTLLPGRATAPATESESDRPALTGRRSLRAPSLPERARSPEVHLCVTEALPLVIQLLFHGAHQILQAVQSPPESLVLRCELVRLVTVVLAIHSEMSRDKVRRGVGRHVLQEHRGRRDRQHRVLTRCLGVTLSGLVQPHYRRHVLVALQVAHDDHEASKIYELVHADHTGLLIIEDRHEVLALLDVQRRLLGLAECQDHRIQLRGIEGAVAILVQLLEEGEALHSEVIGQKVVTQPPREEGNDLVHLILVLLHRLQQLLNLLGLPHDVQRSLGRVFPLVGVQVAHDAQEPGEVEELVQAQHAVPVEVEDGGEALALLVGHCARAGGAQVHDDGEELPRAQDTGLVLVQLHEALVAVHDKLVTRQVLIDILGQERDHLVHRVAVGLEHLQKLLDALSLLGHLRIHLHGDALGRVQERHNHHEASKVHELGLCDDTVLVDVEDFDEVAAVRLGQGQVMSRGHALDERHDLVWLQHTALVLVQGYEVLLTLLRKGVGEDLVHEGLRQERRELGDAVDAVAQRGEELRDLLLAKKHLGEQHLLMLLRVVQVCHDDHEAGQVGELLLGQLADRRRAVLGLELGHVLRLRLRLAVDGHKVAVLLADHVEGVHLDEVANDWVELLRRQRLLLGGVAARRFADEARIACSGEGLALELTH
mmetsp:Transcript_5033/g.12968  ORF Transcript_5033/g.12968 Transcript_5033/m.12968 type:complete len:656 (-) Transcript_5033:1534-3501(-)